MSNDGDDRTPAAGTLPVDYERLDRAVRRLLDEVAGHRARVRVAEARALEVERTLKEISSGELNPVKLRDAVHRLEAENRQLRQRMIQAHDRIRRLVARFDFLREEM